MKHLVYSIFLISIVLDGAIAASLIETNEIEANSAKLGIRGVIRNDSFASKLSAKELYGNVLENRLILEKKTESWQLFTDARFYYYSGYIREFLGESKSVLLRSHLRYFSDLGDFTLGKTYINFGIRSIFNPFEYNKLVTTSDLAYEREGILALEYSLSVGDTSEFRLYSGSQYLQDVSGNAHPTAAFGISFSSNISNSEYGLIAHHKDVNINQAGGFIKTDYYIGIAGAYSIHFDDRVKYSFSQVNLGLDYSFFASKLLVSANVYYNDGGSSNFENYITSNEFYFSAKVYGFYTVSIRQDQFLSYQAFVIHNINDQSLVLVLATSYILANGLAATMQVSSAQGRINTEFSTARSGEVSGLLRIEAKF